MKDPRVERWLDGFKIAWEYVDELPIAAVAIDRQTKENIRMTEVLDDDLVQRYGIALENGAEFPGIVVYRTGANGGGGSFGLINGWHRTEAFKLADRKIISAYVAAVSDKLLIGVLRRTANTLEGKPPAAAEALEQAVFLVRSGYTRVDASRLMSVPIKRIDDRILYDDVRGRLAAMNIDAAEYGLSFSAVARMSKLRDRDLKAVATLSHEARLPAERIMELTRLVREAQSDVDSDSIVEQWRESYRDDIQRNMGGTVRAPATAIRKLPVILRQAERLMAQHGQAVTGLSKKDAVLLIAACRRTMDQLQSMVKLLQEVSDNAR